VQLAILRRCLKNEDEARVLVRELFVSSADIEPDNSAGTLSIHIHKMASECQKKGGKNLLSSRSLRTFIF